MPLSRLQNAGPPVVSVPALVLSVLPELPVAIIPSSDAASEEDEVEREAVAVSSATVVASLDAASCPVLVGDASVALSDNRTWSGEKHAVVPQTATTPSSRPT
jgi:hypothetical protein